MQHYGAPTRLLDVTESPYVAAYFAMEDPTVSEAALWAFDTTQLIEASGVDYTKAFDRDWLDAHVPAVLPLGLQRLSERMTIQQGSFLVPMDGNLTFMENLRQSTPNLSQSIMKIRLENRPQFLERLRRVNITRATLFPGLQGFAESLRYTLVGEPKYNWLRRSATFDSKWRARRGPDLPKGDI